jgi:hypothetical protein
MPGLLKRLLIRALYSIPVCILQVKVGAHQRVLNDYRGPRQDFSPLYNLAPPSPPHPFPSVSDPEPDSIRSVDPDPGGQKLTTKTEQKLKNFMF